MNDNHANDDRFRTPGVQHERTDLSFAGLLFFLLVMGLSGVLIHMAVALIFRAFTTMDVTNRNGRALSSVQLGPLPAEPILEGLTPESDVQIAGPPATYAWIDRDKGIARIPIEKAKAILADRLPCRAATPEPSAATDANGGHPRKGTP